MTEKIPATVVTGFLGAGKTTLIRNLIENANGKKIALIVNEFGDIGVDGDMLKACGNPNCTEEDIIELANGCICCTVAEDFVPTMEKLLAREDKPDAIVIETSGLALPQPLVRAFNWPEIKTQVTVSGVVALVDAAAVADGRFAADEAAVDAQRRSDEMLDHETPLSELFEDQVSCADMVVISKADLVSGEDMAKVETIVAKEARPSVQTVKAVKGNVPIDILLGIGAAAEEDDRLSHHERHHRDAGEDHHHHHHDHDDFETFFVSLGAIDDQQAMQNKIENVMQAHDILRLKGFAAVDGKDMRLVIQAVGPRVDTYFDRSWEEGEKRETQLVVIGETGMDKLAIEGMLAS